jgi:hypothetical protein
MDETCGEVLVDRGGTARDGYVTLTGSGARLVQSRVDSVGDERECRPTRIVNESREWWLSTNTGAW